jgi:hypothetical protein
MRLRADVAAATLFAALGSARPARAQHVEYKAAITLTGSYTQSVSDAPSSFPSTLNWAGPSIALSPSLVALVDTMRTDNTLTYALTLTVPFTRQGDVNQAALLYANHLTYAGHYALSELTTMNLGAGFTETPLNTFVPSQDPTQAPIQAAPAGAYYLITANANEGFARQISERTSFSQSGAFIYGYPIAPGSIRARTFSGTNSFGMTRSFSKDTLGVTLTDQANYFTASRTTTDGPTTLPSQAYVNTLALTWTHAFTAGLTSTLTAGATQTLSPDQVTFMHVQPTGTVALNYIYNLATAALNYTHSVLPNVATGTVNFTDAVSARFSVPIGVTGFHTTGAAGYTHAVPIGTPQVVCPQNAANCASSLSTSPSNVFVGDAALEYKPERVPTLAVALRGQVTRQVLTEDTSLANSFTRYTISLNLTYAYPNVNAAAVRPSLSPLFSAQPPAAADIVSTDRYFSAPTAGPAPEEPLPLPKGP